jgi:hypothetical protein
MALCSNSCSHADWKAQDVIPGSEDQTKDQSEITEAIEPEKVQALCEEFKRRPASVSVAWDAFENGALPTPAREAAEQDASSGKIRGNNGRFISTEKPFQPKRLGKKSRVGKKSKEECKQC